MPDLKSYRFFVPPPFPISCYFQFRINNGSFHQDQRAAPESFQWVAPRVILKIAFPNFTIRVTSFFRYMYITLKRLIFLEKKRKKEREIIKSLQLLLFSERLNKRGTKWAFSFVLVLWFDDRAKVQLIYSRRKREGTTSPAVSTPWEKRNESIRTPDAFAQVCKICYSLVSETQLSYGIKIIARDQQHHRATSKPVVKIDGLSRWSRRASSRISPVDDVSKEINALRRGAVRPMDVTSSTLERKPGGRRRMDVYPRRVALATRA